MASDAGRQRGPRAAEAADPRVLILPGIDDSGPAHWQTLWQADLVGCARVAARDWGHPVCGEWVAALDSTLARLAETDPRPVLLVAHSLGCLQVVHWAAAHTRVVRGALLVAPPDPTAEEFPGAASGFAPLPERVLPFPSVLIASRDDPYASLDFSRRCAEAWHSRFVEIGAHGHINAESGLGDWPQGRAWLDCL